MTRFNTLCLLIAACLPFLSQAQTTWTGNHSSDWHDHRNWSNGAPNSNNNATVPAVISSGRIPEINTEASLNFDVTNHGQINVNAQVNNYGDFKNQPGSFVRNRSEFVNFGQFDNNGVFQNGCSTCDTTGIGLVNFEGGEFSNLSTVVNAAKFVLSPCSRTFFNSPTKTNLGGDIRLYGVAYVLQGDVEFAVQEGTVLFDMQEVPTPSLELQSTTLTLDENGHATLDAQVVDNGSSAAYCRIASWSVSQANFTCANLGQNVVTVTATDGLGNSVSAEVVVTVLPSVACLGAAFTNGGIIGGDQYFCPGDSPAPLYDSIPPSGVPAGYSVDYQWEMTYSDPAVSTSGILAIANSNSANYLVASLPQSAWFRRTARLVGYPTYTAFSNWIKVNWQSPFPTALCQNLIVVKPASGPAVVAADQVDNGSTAGCIGIGSYSLSQSSFNAIGTYNIMLLVASINGDVSACPATVEVRNPPTTSNLVPNCPTTDVQVTAPSYNSTGAVANFSFPVASTNCTLGGATYIQTEGLPSGSTFPVGETQITYVVSDPCGSSTTCGFKVRVVKPAAPTYCASAINGAGTVWLQSVTINGQGQYVYTIKVENRAKWGLSHMAFEVPCPGKKAVNLPATYTGASGRKYATENTTNNPFYSIKFNNSGQEGIKLGQQETFVYVLPATCPVPGTFRVVMKYANVSLSFVLNPTPCLNNGGGNLQAPAYALRSDVQKKSFDVQVKWQSKIGKSVKEYRVERSTDGENFETIHTELGGGADGEISYLSFLDEEPLAGVAYYRVTAILNIGIDWSTDAEKIEMPDFSGFSVYPNPANEKVFLDMRAFEGKKVSVSISNNLGKVVRVLEFENAPSEPLEVDLSGIENGYYNLHLDSEGIKQDKKLVVSNVR